MEVNKGIQNVTEEITSEKCGFMGIFWGGGEEILIIFFCWFLCWESLLLLIDWSNVIGNVRNFDKKFN